MSSFNAAVAKLKNVRIIGSAGNCTVFERSIIRIFHLIAAKGYINFVSLEYQVRSNTLVYPPRCVDYSVRCMSQILEIFMGSN